MVEKNFMVEKKKIMIEKKNYGYKKVGRYEL